MGTDPPFLNDNEDKGTFPVVDPPVRIGDLVALAAVVVSFGLFVWAILHG
jgi:hypothetical protein